MLKTTIDVLETTIAEQQVKAAEDLELVKTALRHEAQEQKVSLTQKLNQLKYNSHYGYFYSIHKAFR